MCSRSKNITVQEALEVILDRDSEIEEDVSEDEDYLELNSDSNDSDFEPDEGNTIPIPPSKTFMSKNGEIQWSSSPNMRQAKLSAENIIKTVPGPTRMAVTRVRDIKSAFELVMPNSIQKIILEMTNLEGRRVFGEEWKELDKTHLDAYFGLLILAGVYKSKDESTASLWDAETGRAIFRATMSLETFHIFSRVIRFDNRETRAGRWERDNLAAIRTVWDKWVEQLPLLYNPGPNVTVDERLVAFRGRCPFRQYMPSKPAKYGIKIWAACDANTSYALNMQVVYTGKPVGGAPEKNQGKRVVLDKAQGLRGHNITCDNFFTSYNLGQELLKRKLTMVRTVRKNRAELPAELLVIKNRAPQSSMFAFTDTTALVSYCPKKGKNVVVMSTLHKNMEISTMEDQKAFVIWTEIFPEWNVSKLYKRRIFLKELGKALVTPHIQRRQHLPRTPAAAATVREIQERTAPSTPVPEAAMFDLESFLDTPTLEQLNSCGKDELAEIADHFSLTYSKSMLKRDLKALIIGKLVDMEVLVLPVQSDDMHVLGDGTPSEGVEAHKVEDEPQAAQVAATSSGGAGVQTKTPHTLPRFDPHSPGSTGSRDEARLKVRMARLKMESEEKLHDREAKLKYQLEVRKLEIEADKAVRLWELELQSQRESQTSPAPAGDTGIAFLMGNDIAGGKITPVLEVLESPPCVEESESKTVGEPETVTASPGKSAAEPVSSVRVAQSSADALSLPVTRERLCAAQRADLTLKKCFSKVTVMKRRFDRATIPRSFVRGDKVLALLPITSSALSAKFSGPYEIRDHLSDTDYVISTPERRHKTRVCHVNMLKQYHSQTIPAVLPEFSDAPSLVLSLSSAVIVTETPDMTDRDDGLVLRPAAHQSA
ncbi:LOW QUALITY PROTEIN: uncharacterized protein LOC143333911 [Chaetodon auriga]|uniref:LOW QUALITY PROTEIN: uncharacterized protein LOC143333911 n=1 Tax=Chaetodon auriga TaxID=39042 RepID=UPI004033014F